MIELKNSICIICLTRIYFEFLRTKIIESRQSFLYAYEKKLKLMNHVNLTNKEITDAKMLLIIEVEFQKKIIKSYE